jgi:phenylalanyl-tRNA synthetase beta chain
VLTNTKIREEEIKVKENKSFDIKDYISVGVKNSKDCYRYTGRIIKGIKIKSSPRYIKERLFSCGLEPINNIVDAANYIMLELGQPLHAFDLDKIEGSKILIRRAKNGEKINTLDDKNYRLNNDVLVISDIKKVLAIAGIKGGKSVAINDGTKDIFIESANFNPTLIRKTSKKLNLKTDASFRFEHGMDSNLTEKAIDRLAELIQEVAGGDIVKGKIDIYPNKILSKSIKLDLRQTEKLLGVKISKNEIVRILKSLGLGVNKKLEIKIPTWRPDLNQNEDLIEEIGRIYGYENLKADFPKITLMPGSKNEEIIWEYKIKDTLRAVGFSEVYNYSFINKKIGDYSNSPLVELENPFSEEFYYLRPNLIINLLGNIKHNIKYFKKDEAIRIFEFGTVFKKTKNGIKEKKMLTGLITGNGQDFYALKGVVDALLESLGISDKFYDNFQISSENSQQIFWNIHKSAEIKANNMEIGFIGQLSSDILLKLENKKSVIAFEIDFNKLIKICNGEKEYQAASKFPSAIRDISILVPMRVKVADILNQINSVKENLVQDVDLFDIYEGDKKDREKKSLAFHIIFQAKNRTLNGDEIEFIFQKIIKALEENADWEVRKQS